MPRDAINIRNGMNSSGAHQHQCERHSIGQPWRKWWRSRIPLRAIHWVRSANADRALHPETCMNRSDVPTASEPVRQPKIHVGRMATGMILGIIGIILLPTITLTAIGIALCIVGAALIAFAVANRKYGATHSASHAAHHRPASSGHQ